MNLRLPSEVVSRQDFRAAISDIKQCAGWLASSQIKQRVSAKAQDQPPSISPAADSLIKQWHGNNQVSQKSLEELVRELEDFAATAQRIVITLAAPPPSAIKQALSAWCREHMDPNILVDFKFNSTMLGGMAVEYGSHVYDWSFRRQILSAKDKFPEILRRV
jgi:F0F1-type ATP synthase delta subunit